LFAISHKELYFGKEAEMPNILIVGFEKGMAESLRTRANVTMASLGKENDAIITIITAETQKCITRPETRDHPETAPYIVVRDSNKNECEEIAKTLNRILNVDVEYETIDGFIPKRD
jgi:hypothetical protein